MHTPLNRGTGLVILVDLLLSFTLLLEGANLHSLSTKVSSIYMDWRMVASARFDVLLLIVSLPVFWVF